MALQDKEGKGDLKSLLLRPSKAQLAGSSAVPKGCLEYKAASNSLVYTEF